MQNNIAFKMSLENKVVLVTGASSGIGAAIAVLFAKEKANVAIVGRDINRLKITAANCDKYGKKALIIAANITKEHEAKCIVQKTVKEFGKLDVLINNAGLMRMASITDDNLLQAYDETMNTNMRAALHITNLAAQHLIETKGNIINISSIAGVRVPDNPKQLSYCISKAAMDHFSRCVAAELAPKGVRVNTINPGPVLTDFANHSDLEPEIAANFFEDIKEGTALGRSSDVDEVSEMALYLASDKARGITGSRFVIDNGRLLKLVRK